MAQRHQRHRGFLLALSAVQRQQKEAEQQQQQQQQHAPPTVRGETPAPRSSHERSSAAAPTRPFSAPLVDTPSIPLPSPQLQLVLRWPVALRVGSAAGVDGWVLREKLQSRLSAAIVDGSLRAAPVDKEDGAAVGMAAYASDAGRYRQLEDMLATPLKLKFPGTAEAATVALDRQRSGLQVVQSALQAQIEAVGAAFSAPFAESEPGERADTLHVAGLPRRWFAPLAGGLSSTGEGDDTPTAVSHGIDLNVVAEMFQNLGPLRRIEVVVAETACEIEGPEGKFTAAGVPATVHVVPLRPLDTIAQPAKDAAAVAVDRSLQFEVYAQYATQSGLETALGHFIGRQLVYSPAGRGPFQAALTVAVDLSKRLSQRALRQRRLAAEDEKLRRQKRQEEEARQAQIAQRLAEEKRQKALEEARRRTEEEAERRRIQEQQRREQEAKIEEERRRRAEETRLRREAEEAERRAAEERRREEETRERAAKAAEERQREAERQAERQRLEEEKEAKRQALLEEKAQLEVMRRSLVEEEVRLRRQEEQALAAKRAADEQKRQEDEENERLRQKAMAEKDELARKRRKMALARLRGEPYVE